LGRRAGARALPEAPRGRPGRLPKYPAGERMTAGGSAKVLDQQFP
jgi:hypothetical protein